MTPRTRYARSGDLAIAYRVVGSGDVDLVMVPGFVSNLDWFWHGAGPRRLMEGMASFSRLIVFDKRGTGLSDPVATPGTLEDRVEDLRAVMDAAGSEHAALFGTSEGAAMSMVFAAQHPERARALILYGATLRFSRAADFPYGPDRAELAEFLDVLVAGWGEGVALEIFAPSHIGDRAFEDWFSDAQRSGASPGMARQLFAMWTRLDVRGVLSAIHVPTLVLHRRGDHLIDVSVGRYLADHIAGARYVELDGEDHVPFSGDIEQLVAEVQEFVTGSRPRPAPDRVLATVLFVDVAGSTELAARVGDLAWSALRARFLATAREELIRYSGTEVDVAGDGLFATFTGPARAIRCALAIRRAVGEIDLRVRAGVHAGEVERNERGDGYSGLAVHIGARVMAEAEPGEVLVSGTVKDLVVGSGLEFADRGTHTLRGVPGTWPLFATVG